MWLNFIFSSDSTHSKYLKSWVPLTFNQNQQSRLASSFARFSVTLRRWTSHSPKLLHCLRVSIFVAKQLWLLEPVQAGIGLKTARQLLKLHLSHLILTVRNVSKGEACKQEIQQLNRQAQITVLELDMNNYNSVLSFAKTLEEEVPTVNILLLNAGIGLLKLERSPSGHDCVTQVNYLSNALLIAALLPYLKASAETSGVPSRITWVGSRMYFTTSLEEKAPIKTGESVLEHMDSKEFFFP